MATALVLFFALAAPVTTALPASAQGSLVSPQPARARVELVSDQVRIGEPIELTFVVEHADSVTVVLPDPATLPRSLAFVRDLGSRRQDDSSASDRRITRARLTPNRPLHPLQNRQIGVGIGLAKDV